jgi:transcriptional regulator with XRE-family HTH domain
MSASTLARTLSDARARSGLSLRDVERRTGIRSGHLSQIETGAIAKPEMALLWELAALYAADFGELLALAGYATTADRAQVERHRMTVAMRAMGELTPAEQAEALRFMAQLKARRADA